MVLLLDPSAQGLAFSRRYGFVMDSMTDPLPGHQALAPVSVTMRWARIGMPTRRRKLLRPIFGAGGFAGGDGVERDDVSSTFTAPPGTNTYTATFDAYLADAASGVERPNTSTGAFTMHWTSVEDGRPSLTIGRKLMVSWVAESGRYVLESADSVPAG